MFKSLPSDVLNYSYDNFYQLVKERCGDNVVEFMKLLDISSVQSLLGVENLFDYLEFNSEKLNANKKKLAFQHENGLVEVKWGVRNSLECLIRDLKTFSNNNQRMTESIVLNDDMILPSSFLQKHPMLKCLINLYRTIDDQNNEDNSENTSFLNYFLDNISSNLCRSKNAYRYNEPVLRFAMAFHVLSGNIAYEFVRLNVPGVLPALSTLQGHPLNKQHRMKEAEFRFDSLSAHMNSLKTNIAFAAEDCTAVIKKISYDSFTNSFVGLVPPLNDGIPTTLHYQTDSFKKLREWFSNEDRSHLINIHMIQPITNMQIAPNPFLLSAFGTNNKYEAIDIIRRWIWIFEQSSLQDIRIVGFSTDGDPKYMRAMRLVTGFFASLPNIKLNSYTNAFHVKIPKDWNWYFLGDSHLFLCFQDATHLCTKLRNRLLSRTANMLIGNHCISINYLSTLIRNIPKLRHGLVKSDIFPQDRQNFSSCVKICSDDVTNCLTEIHDSEGIIMYIHLLRSIMIAYIEKLTTPINRLYHAWFSVFVSRLWYIWIDYMPKVNLEKSLYELSEINAHQLTYLALLVTENKLPPEVMNIYLFSSQTCEGMFRSARSMPGTFSSVLSLLQKLKTESEFYSTSGNLLFPKHYKQRKQLRQSQHVIPGNDILNVGAITKVVCQAYNDAVDLLSRFKIKNFLNTKKITNMKEANNCMQSLLRQRINIQDYSDLNEEDESSDSDNESDEMLDSESDVDSEDQQYDDQQHEASTISSDGIFDDIDGIKFSGMRVFDKVRPELEKSYFELEIKRKKKFIHKQTACWILTENKSVLSNDRLTRVTQK
ncbi:unnamed protein product [Rotaria socialis]